MPLVGCCPLWSPDGARIAYLVHGKLHVVNADGTHNRPIKTPGIDVEAPAWSPDGQWIAFGTTQSSGLHRHSDIYLIRPNGNDLHPITHEGAGGLGPVWSPDGRRIAFVSHRDGDHEIYVMNKTAATNATSPTLPTHKTPTQFGRPVASGQSPPSTPQCARSGP